MNLERGFSDWMVCIDVKTQKKFNDPFNKISRMSLKDMELKNGCFKRIQGEMYRLWTML